MKYFVRVSIVLLIAVGIVFGFSYYYREKKNNENIVLTTQVITTTKPNQTGHMMLPFANLTDIQRCYSGFGEFLYFILCHLAVLKHKKNTQ